MPCSSEKARPQRYKIKTGLVGQPLNQLVCKRDNLSGKRPYYMENIKTKDKQLILWAGPSPNTSGTGPAHHLEKCQLIWKIVKNILMRQLNIIMHFLYFLFILRSKIQFNVICLNHTSSQVPLSRKRLILGGSCSRFRLGHTSDKSM